MSTPIQTMSYILTMNASTGAWKQLADVDGMCAVTFYPLVAANLRIAQDPAANDAASIGSQTGTDFVMNPSNVHPTVMLNPKYAWVRGNSAGGQLSFLIQR